MQQLEWMAKEHEADPETVSPAAPRAVRIHPQLVLWMVRGVLGATAGVTVLALLPEKMIQQPMPQTIVRSASVQGEMIALPASLTMSPQAALGTVMAPRVIEAERERNTSKSDVTEQPSSFQSQHQASPRQLQTKPFRQRSATHAHRSHKNPLAALARGAKRTFRTVGRKLGRLL